MLIFFEQQQDVSITNSLCKLLSSLFTAPGPEGPQGRMLSWTSLTICSRWTTRRFVQLDNLAHSLASGGFDLANCLTTEAPLTNNVPFTLSCPATHFLVSGGVVCDNNIKQSGPVFSANYYTAWVGECTGGGQASGFVRIFCCKI